MSVLSVTTIMEILGREFPDLPVIREGTGGNISTVFVGTPDGEGYFPCAIGPCWWSDARGEWIGEAEELGWGPDFDPDKGEVSRFGESTGQVAARIVEWVRNNVTE